MRTLQRGSEATLIFAICFTILMVTSALLSQASAGVSGQDKRVIKEDTIWPFNEPIKVRGVKLRGKPVKLGEELDAGGDWLKKAELTLKNVSGKEVVFIELRINFPETRATGNEMSFRENIGVMPYSSVPPARPPLSLPPDGAMEFVIDDEKYRRLEEFVRRRSPVVSLHKAHVVVGFVVFADGTAWGAGGFLRRDPNNPNVWQPTNPHM